MNQLKQISFFYHTSIFFIFLFCFKIFHTFLFQINRSLRNKIRRLYFLKKSKFTLSKSSMPHKEGFGDILLVEKAIKFNLNKLSQI